MSNNPNEAQSTRVERPDVTIKKIVTPLSNDVKVKINNAMVQIVDKIKEKHLS
jgi:hypothetical protein